MTNKKTILPLLNELLSPWISSWKFLNYNQGGEFWLTPPKNLLAVYLRYMVLVASIHTIKTEAAESERYVEISALIESVHFESDQTNRPIQNNPIHIVCVVGKNEWRIDNDYSQNSLIHRYYDGTNVFDSSELIKPAAKETTDLFFEKFGVAPVPFEIAKSNIQINIRPIKGGHPFGDEGVNLPWLAFCSGTYLKEKGRVIPPPVGDLPISFDAYAYSDKTILFKDDFGLPKSVDLYTSDSLFAASLDDFNELRGKKIKNRKGFGDNLIKFHYEVSESTNFLGWNFPLKFDFFQKNIDNGIWYVGYQGSGKILSIKDAKKPLGLIQGDSLKVIVDYRFRSDIKRADCVIYKTTNDFAFSTNNTYLKNKFSLDVNNAPPRESALSTEKGKLN